MFDFFSEITGLLLFMVEPFIKFARVALFFTLLLLFWVIISLSTKYRAQEIGD